MLKQARRYFTGKFFYPDTEDFGSPALQGVPFEDVFFPSKNKKQLNGFFMKAARPNGGTIVHCHGNAGNITGHFPLVLFLVEAGFNVFVFDYGGYGKSEGRPSPESIIEDALAAVAYVRSRSDVDAKKVALFGQSLGGAAAAGAMAGDPAIPCLVLEAAFTSYRKMAKETVLGKLLFFIRPFVIPNIGPKYDLRKISKRPVLIIHGDADEVVPVRFGRELHAASRDFTELLILPGVRHLEGSEQVPAYHQRVIKFLSDHLT